MNICFVSYEFPPQFGGGIGTYVGTITKNLAEEGNNVHVVTFNPGNLADYEMIHDVHIHRVGMADHQVSFISSVHSDYLSTLLYWSHYSEKVYHLLKKLSLSHSFDVIEFCDYRGEGYFSMLGKRMKGEFADSALVVRMHTPLFVLNKFNGVQQDPGMQQLENFENYSIMLSDYIVSPSRVLASYTKEDLKVEKDIAIIPHPIDVESIDFSEYTESNTLLYVGRLEKRKGVVDLVEAMVQFFEQHGGDLTVKLIGGDTDSGPGRTSMKDHLLSLIPSALKKRFVFVDRLPREEVLKEYSKAKAAIFPSLFENFPNVCLEAMSSGVPVIIGDHSGMADMIVDKVSGLSFRSGDIEDLINKVNELISMSHAERAQMGKAARIRVEEEFSKKAINQKHIDYYTSISKKKSIDPGITNYSAGLVSVVIPCYNHGEFLKETIQSVLDSEYTKTEIIVVNDGSTDPNTIKILDEVSAELPQVKVVHQENGGLSAARNTGVSHATGEYILPLDADDLIDKTFLTKTVRVLEENEKVGFVYTYVQFFGAADGVWKTPEFDPNLLLVSNLCVATSLFRHEAFDQIGGYKTDMIYGFEDWDFWIYMTEHGWSGKCVPEPLFFYRKHQESMLSGSQKNRSYLINKLIEHHRESYKRSLDYVIVEKDRLFFQEHMSNYHNYMELNGVVNSKAWRLIRRYRKIKDMVITKFGGLK